MPDSGDDHDMIALSMCGVEACRNLRHKCTLMCNSHHSIGSSSGAYCHTPPEASIDSRRHRSIMRLSYLFIRL